MTASPHTPAADQVAMARPAVARRTLDNGLRVVIVSDHAAPVAAVHLTYRVGSRDERPGRTGFAHLFEHLMFQGSEHVEPGELMGVVTEAGGSPNAMTFFDWTQYHEEVPIGALELALWLEADRMGGMPAKLTQAALETEREVVLNERRETEKQPYGDQWEILFAALFDEGHPYSWTPIGAAADVLAAQLDEVRDFFAERYGPNNCTLAIAGDVTAERGFELAERYFGGIPANPRIPEVTATTCARRTSELRIEAQVPGPVPACTAMFIGPPLAHPDYVPLAVASEILAGGEASRLVDRLVRRDEIASTVECGLTDLMGEATVGVLSAYLNGEGDFEAFERVRDEEVSRLAAEGPTAAELQRAVARQERQVWEEAASVQGLAGLYSMIDGFRPGYDPITDFIADLHATTAADVMRAMSTWMTPENRVVLTYQGDGSDLAEFEADFDGDFGVDLAADSTTDSDNLNQEQL